MLRNRLLVLLGGCLALGSTALADDLGYVDCASHPEDTQVFAKARRSQDVVATVPCGERFKVILYGFIFSEVQTSDGKVGFVYSSVMTVDRSGGKLQARAASDAQPQMTSAAETTKIYAPKETPASSPARTQASPVTNAPVQVESQPAQTAAADTVQSTTAPASSGTSAAPPQAVAPAAAPATFADSATVLKATTPGASTSSAPATPPASGTSSSASSAAAQTQPSADAPTSNSATPSTARETPSQTAVSSPAPTPETAVPPSATNVSSSVPADTPSATLGAAQPEAAASSAAEPQPAPAQPEIAPVTSSRVAKTESWEKPNPGARSASLLELFGGFAFARMSSGGGYTNANNFLGGLGSFGFNWKPWMQIVGDTSYNYYSLSGTKNVLWGNHYGPRVYWRKRNPFNVMPFGEALFGGSRADTTVPASLGYPAYTASQNCFSMKIGGGIDMHTRGMFEVRVIDVDYYRTAFGTNLHQTNYWISTGVVIRLFRSKEID